MDNKKIFVALLIGILVVAFGLNGGANLALGQEAKTITFGIITPLSGPAAVWGISSSRSIMLNAWKINDQGGFKVKGETYKWNVIAYDSKMIPADSAKAANKAIYSDKAKFLSIMGTPQTLACYEDMKANNVLSLNPAGGGKQLINPNHPLIFRYNSSVDGMYLGFLPVLREREKIKTMAVINMDTDGGRSGTDSARLGADFCGIKVVADEYYQQGIKDFSALLTRILAKNPDLIDTSITEPTNAALICKQARELGYKGAILLAWAPDFNDVLKIAGANAENAYLMTVGPLEPQTPVQREYYERFLKKFSARDWDALYWHHTEMIPCVTKAMVETQTLDPFILAKHMENMTWESPVGTLRWGGSKLFGVKRQLIYPDSLYQFQQGKAVYIGTPPIPGGILDP